MITLKPKYHRKLKTYADLGVYILLLILSLVLLGTVTSCQKNELALPNACGTMATIKDLRGLDGCGFVLELDNGERLEPIYNYGFCGTPPLPAPTIDNVDFIDGKRVSIAYNVLPDRGSICMAGKVVEITCISESGDASE
jgi:hypothetical protein